MSCTYYQPLPISTGAIGIDRCGNIEVYAAPSIVRNRVCWSCWPIQPQFGFLYGSCPPGGTPWWWSLPHPAHPIVNPLATATRRTTT